MTGLRFASRDTARQIRSGARNSAPRRERDRYLSIATLGLLLQVCHLYWYAGLYKDHEIWHSGQAVMYALEIDEFTTPLGLWLKGQPLLMSLLTTGVHPTPRLTALAGLTTQDAG